MHAQSDSRTVEVSGIEVAALVHEFRPLIGSYVSNIYSMGDAHLLKLRKGEEEKTLLISPRLGAWLTSRGAWRSTTTAFTTSLRRELLRLRLEQIGQLDLDRVFLFTFSDKQGKKELVVELMPPGNLIVLEGEKVSLALREVRTPQRRIMMGLPYSHPVQSRISPDRVDRQALKSIFEKEGKLGRALGRGVSLPRRYIDEILRRSGLAQGDPSPKSDEKIDAIVATLDAMLEEAKRPIPYLVRIGDETHMMAVKPSIGIVERVGPTFSELLDETLGPAALPSESEEKKERDNREGEYRATLEKLARQSQTLEEDSKRIREAAVMIGRASSKDGALELLKDVRSLVPASARGAIEGASSPSSIASALFDLAKDKEAEAERIREAAAELRKRMEREQRHAEKSEEARPREQRKREWYEKFRWFFTSGGKLAMGGRDAHSNALLIKRHLEQDDVVYHADLFGSPFFVLKGGEAQTEQEIREVAKATVAFSSGWKTGLGSADAYWVKPDQVSATAPSGEYLPKGSFAIRGKKNFVTKNIMEISIGTESEGRMISGPEEAIMQRASIYLTLVPSREKASETAKKVLAELRKVAVGIPIQHTIDDVIRMLPSGGGKIIRRKVRA